MPPTTGHLSRAYHELAKHGARAVGAKEDWPYQYEGLEGLLALTANMSRHDPRLFSIMVEFLFFHWKEVNPLKLRQCLKEQQAGHNLLVMMSFVSSGTKDSEVCYLMDYLSRGYLPVEPQLYFLGLYLPGSKSMERATLEPLQEFYSWGFLARERPVIHDTQRSLLGHWGSYARQNMLRRMILAKEIITVSDYLEVVEHTISRQQALADLKESRFVSLQGKGRGAVWVRGRKK